MKSNMLGIGSMARASGLSVSALRFYDSAEVFVPALVDRQTGYRWYGHDQVNEARLIARLRRVGMALPAISRVLDHRSDPAAVVALLKAHLRRLEEGLSDARRELSAVEQLILGKGRSDMAATESPFRLSVDGPRLFEALTTVRFAVSTDPEFPMLGGVLLEAADNELRLVATDRCRLAIASTPATDFTARGLNVIAPTAFIDDLLAALEGQADELTINADEDQIIVTIGTHAITSQRLDHDFPDYRRLLRTQRDHRVEVDAAALREMVRGAAAARGMTDERHGAESGVTVLVLDDTGVLSVDPEVVGGHRRVGVNREFLLQAVDAAAGNQLVLELDGPISPIAIRNPASPERLSILMPVELPAAE
ncbi:MerR family transcriptional regulator [Rhodococcus maanshanensis]|uniref:DNA polymerase III subunit beta family protein n=1 Tax=Rhodococcus maanshanensis TaxID=183556 RepID=UPI0022B36DD3|nr:MerR family transcriptional regulator [Rhodococcus maanshanensis]MCZ4557894.1 MerR family transcriptional regulator [Rhodococcus maanshanensis]